MSKPLYLIRASELGQSLQHKKDADPAPKVKALEIARAVLQVCPNAKLPELYAEPGFCELLDDQAINKFAFRDALSSVRKAVKDRPARPPSKVSSPVKSNASVSGRGTVNRRLEDTDADQL